jgi:hypothetical protein
LRLRFDTHVFGTMDELIAASAQTRPHAVVLNIRQVEGNGLTAATALRKALGVEPMLLVVGPAAEVPTPEQRQAVARRHRADLWVPRVLDIPTLDVLLWSELVQRCLPREVRAGAAPGTLDPVRGIAPRGIPMAEARPFPVRARTATG